MTDVVLQFDYVDDEIRWPEVSGGRLADGYVKAVASAKRGVKQTWLSIVRMKKIYAFGGKLYVLYDAEDVRLYEPFMAQLPPLAAELDYEAYYELVDGCGCSCKTWRLLTSREEEAFLQKLLGTEVEPAHFAPRGALPANFSVVPVGVVLYESYIAGIAVAENPRFARGDKENVYEGRYVVLEGGHGYKLFRIHGDAPPLEKVLEKLVL
jgi:hypothetical protein